MFALLTTAAIAASPAAPTVTVDVGRPSHGVVAGVVDAPLHQVLDVVLDCGATDEWFPELLDTHPVGARCAGATNVPWPLADRTWEIEVDAQERGDAWVVTFAYVEGSGNLAAMHGHYTLRGRPDGTTDVRYEAWIDLGFWVPEPLVAWATRRVLPGILTGLEFQARRVDEARALAARRP